MNKIANSNASIFYRLDLNNPTNNQKKLVVVDREVKSLGKAEIELERKGNKKIIDSLDTIAELSKQINIDELNEAELLQLSKNYRWINAKIQKHNRNIDNHLIKKVVDKILSVLPGWKFRLKYKTLEDQIQLVQDETAKKIEGEQILASWAQAPRSINQSDVSKLIYFLRKFSLKPSSIQHLVTLWPYLPQEVRGLSDLIKKFICLPPQLFALLPKALRIDVLMSADDHTLLQHYQGRSFFTDFQLNALGEEKINTNEYEKEKELLLRMIKLKHRETLLEVQNTPILRHLVIKELTNYMKSFSDDGNAQHALQALQNLERLQQYIPQENLLEILMFISENKHLMAAGKIGTQSQSRSNVRKVTIGSYKLEYQADKQTGIREIIVKLGFLGQGGFKIVKKLLLLSTSHMPIEAQGMQHANANGVADRELYFLRMVKGLPHVIQFREVKVYYSKRKWKQNIQALRAEYYNMGELFDHVVSGKLTNRNKLQIAIDLFKGIQAIHALGIIHRDIKPENIFLNKTIEGGKEVIHAYVGDFGAACERDNDPNRYERVGTPEYLSPGLIRGTEKTDFATDAFACGVTLYAMLNNAFPLPAYNASNFQQAVTDWDDPVRNPRPADENSLEYVTWKLLRIDQSDRMGIDEALKKVEALLAATA